MRTTVKSVTKLILPVAGLGKRLRPLTLRKPKALVRVNGGPLLEYMLKEAAASGIQEVTVVASPQHRKQFAAYIRRHRGDFPGIRTFILRIQRKPLGDGHAVLQAIGRLHKGEPVAVRFADDLILTDIPPLASLIGQYVKFHAPVLLLERVPKRDVSRYGIVEVLRTVSRSRDGRTHVLRSFVEKPAVADAPSTLAAVGGYILSPEFITALKRRGNDLVSTENDALRLADVFRAMLKQKKRVCGFEFRGRRLDCGTLEGFRNAERVMHRLERTAKRKKRA
ncbi:MAG: UTP-glucose-phosphate uridylyltransferase [Candidatus Parcubacteria bacterium]|jgi:UTP--glucose-1-phosphate uridylyltransferase